jgi:Flp pilus assembly protein TadG
MSEPRTPPPGNLLRSARGSALIEFALASTLFFMTLFGIFEFTQAVWRYNMVSNLAQEAARWASVRGSGAATGGCSVCTATCIRQATNAELNSYINCRALGLSVVATTYTVDPTTKACTTTTTDPSSLGWGDGVCVTVSTQFAPVTAWIPFASITLDSTAQMIMSR